MNLHSAANNRAEMSPNCILNAPKSRTLAYPFTDKHEIIE